MWISFCVLIVYAFLTPVVRASREEAAHNILLLDEEAGEHDGKSTHALHQVIVEDDPATQPCKDGCTYHTITTHFSWGWHHKKIGKGQFAEMLVVKDASNKAGTEYVWKRFNEEAASGVEIDEDDIKRFVAATKLGASANCPNTMVPRDFNPTVHHRRVRSNLKYTGNGLITEKMEGDVYAYLKDVCKTDTCRCTCGRKFMMDMLNALLCLRQTRKVEGLRKEALRQYRSQIDFFRDYGSDELTRGLLHTDVKLDNVLYKCEPGPCAPEQCPEFKLNDFDLLSEVGEVPQDQTPPLGKVRKAGYYEKNARTAGFEDVVALAIAYNEKWGDTNIENGQVDAFIKFAVQKLHKKTMKTQPLDGNLLQPGSFPPLGCFKQ